VAEFWNPAGSSPHRCVGGGRHAEPVQRRERGGEGRTAVKPCGCRKPHPRAVTCRFSGTAEDRRDGYARMIHRATATALPGAHERLHLHTPAAHERHGQRHRDSCAAPPARHPAAPDRQAPPHPARPGVPRRSSTPATEADAAAAPPDRLPRHRPALAPRPTTPPPRQDVPPETARPTAHRS
jgi:hypothetical protein